jgi:hypothetical protein
MRGRWATVMCAFVVALPAYTSAAAQMPPRPQLAVCLVLSAKLSISERAANIVLAESDAIWMPHGVGVHRAADDGGMGDVYRARDTRLGRTVAIKLLNAELSGDATSRARFEREARSIAALTHPHICTVQTTSAITRAMRSW